MGVNVAREGHVLSGGGHMEGDLKIFIGVMVEDLTGMEEVGREKRSE